MPKIRARMYVNVRLLTTETGPGTVLTKTVVRPRGSDMLEVLRNGGGKSTLTAIELFSLVTRAGANRSRVRDLFRPGVGPTYVAYDMQRTGGNWKRGYDHDYIICAFERRSGEEGVGDVKRAWAFLPAASAGDFERLPICREEGGRRSPLAFDDFVKWAREVPEGSCLLDHNLALVDEKLRGYGLSPKELLTQFQINYDEGGIENYFGRATTSDSFFEDCLMPVVTDSIWGRERSEGWLVDDVLALAETARDKNEEISKLDAYQGYGEALRRARQALSADNEARRRVSELWHHAGQLAYVADNRATEIDGERKASEEELATLTKQERDVQHTHLSVEYYKAGDKCHDDESRESELKGKLDGLSARLDEVRHGLALDSAAQAYGEWKPAHDDMAALEGVIATMEADAGRLGEEANGLQAMAMFAWDQRLSDEKGHVAEAKADLDRAKDAERKSQGRLAKARERLNRANQQLGAREANLENARASLNKALESDPAIEECMEVASAPDLLGKYDLSRADSYVNEAAHRVDKSERAVGSAKRDEAEAEAAVALRQEEQLTAADTEATARRALDDITSKYETAKASFENLDSLVDIVAPELAGIHDLSALKAALKSTMAEASTERASIESRRTAIQGQLDALDRGSMRIDRRLESLMDELGIAFHTASDIARQRDIDLATYLRDDPWIADVVFMSEDDAHALSEAMPGRDSEGSFIALVSTTDSLDELLAPSSSKLRVYSNVISDWIINPEGWKRAQEDLLDRLEHALESIASREEELSDANNAVTTCKAHLGTYASLEDMASEAEEARSAWVQAKNHLSEQDRRLEEANDEHARQKGELSRLETRLSEDSAKLAKWKAVREAMRTLNECVEGLGEAKGDLDLANANEAAATADYNANAQEREDAFRTLTNLEQRLREVQTSRSEVWTDALTPNPDPEGRDAEALTAAWRLAREELERESDSLAAELREKRNDLKTLKLREGMLRTSLDKACVSAGITHEEAKRCLQTLDPLKTAHLKEEESGLSPEVEASQQELAKAHDTAVQSRTRFEEREKDLARAGFGAPKPRDDCWHIDIEAELSRIHNRQNGLNEALEALKAERAQMSVIFSEATDLAHDLRSAGAFRDFEPLTSARIDAADAGGICDFLREDGDEAIQRRRETSETARQEIDALPSFASYDDTLSTVVRDTADTLKRSLGDINEYQADSTIRNLDDSIESCTKMVDLLLAQLHEYEQRLAQTTRTCAKDVSEALSKLAGIVRDATVDVSAEGQTRRTAEFLELLLGGESVRSIASKKPRAEMVHEADTILLPHLRRYIEETLAPMTSEAAIKEAARKELTLSHLVRVFVGGGDTPCGVTVRHATYTKLETRRHKDWSSLFKRGSVAQSGAETTLVFFVIYLAITKCIRSTEIPEGEDGGRFVILDNPFTKMSDSWAIEFLGRVARHFDCQMVVKTALREIAAHNVFPYVCSYREGKRASDGTIVMDYETEMQGIPEDAEQDFDVFATNTKQMRIEI